METQNKQLKTKYFILADRISAWVLLFVILAYIITGYGMTKGLISADLSRVLHLGWLGLVGSVAFIIHTGWAIHLALLRHNIWNRAIKICLVICYLLLIVFFLWVHFFYQSNSAVQIKDDYITTDSVQNNTNSNQTVFTKETIKNYNGLNGKPAYVAIDGVVYDMTREFRNGAHYGYTAGQDLSTAFHAKHPNRYLNGLEVMGIYKE